MIRAAGIILRNKEGHVLLLQRGPTSRDFPNHWAIPGGVVEEGETSIDAAIRETLEEAGFEAKKDDLRLWTRALRDDVEFTAFIHLPPVEFAPTLGPEGNPENVSWAWASVDHPPTPLHPGDKVVLERFSMNELDVARAIMDRRLASPQFYENVALFDLRITGTGVAYRHKLDEYVWRDPSLYLNDEFLARCNGLPVIFEHPPTNVLNSEEFKNRAVGTIMLPYIKGEEVWGIAKIFDAAAAEMMSSEQLSTSPAVVWRDPDVNDKLETESGAKFLIEGKPSLLDHLAICEQGVWDKGGEPTGVKTTTEGMTTMADDKNVRKDSDEEVKKDDANEGQPLDKLLAGLDAMHAKLDSMHSRMDEMEAKYGAKQDAEPEVPVTEGEPEPVMADEGEPKVDDAADEPPMAADEEKDERMDSLFKKQERELNELRRELAGIKSKLPKQLNDADYAAFADAQARADAVYSAFGESAPRPLQGEGLLAYRRRLATKLKSHSAAWKEVDLGVVAVDDAAFSVAEKQIFADAMAAARNPASVPAGRLRPVTRKLASGHTVTEYMGSPSTWMNRFASNKRFVTKINLEKGN